MKRDKLYIIAKHYTIVKDVPHGPTVTVKPTAYLLSLPPQASIAEVASYIESLEADLRQYTGASTSKRRQKVSRWNLSLRLPNSFSLISNKGMKTGISGLLFSKVAAHFQVTMSRT